ncbi:sensor histidine kinase [Geitlerinema sp. P-1104]|uniref:GAF domain-containing sensor histidine kinase n=1 Tax=Geitlerinema sp. P-1104 TaxID=2546230 RepID=UPI00147712C0|nr:GAF domain-containing protein [Geitlerinema sp. P-1104]NMG58617.1 sensor histidine kinase [Geitlerinema sp. P-1104]
MLNLDQWDEVRSCCQDDAAFERLKQILDPSQTSTAPEESAALAQARLQIERQNALANAIARIRESLELQEIFDSTTQELRQLLGADRIAIYRFYPDFSGEFVAESVQSGHPRLIKSQPSPSQSYSRQILLGRGATSAPNTVKPMIKPEPGHQLPTPAYKDLIENPGTIPLSEQGKSPAQILEEHGSPDSAIVPILQGEVLWGLLCASHSQEQTAWNLDDIELLDRVSVNLSVALKQAELFQRTQDQARKLAKATRREKTLAVTVEKIRRSLDIDTIFSTTTHEVRQLLDVDRVAVYYFNPDWTGQFVAESVSPGWVHLLELQTTTPQLQTNLALCSKMQELIKGHKGSKREQNPEKLPHRCVFTVEDVKLSHFAPAYQEVLQLYQCQAYAIVPIYQSSQLWGLLAAYHNAQPRVWDSSDIDLLAQISEHLGVALQQAELLEQTRMQARRLAQTLQDLQKTQTQLIHSEKMAGLGQLVAGVAHEINNPVNFIYGNLSYVRDYTQDLMGLIELYQQDETRESEAIAERIEDIDLPFILEDLPNLINSMKTGTDRIRKIVQSLRIFSRLDEAQRKTVDIHEGLESVLWLLKHRFKTSFGQEIKIIKKFKKLPRINCYPAELNQVFMNLINNSLDALSDEKNSVKPDYKKPAIAILTQQINNEIVAIRIADNGVGIAEPIRRRIFDPFFTTKSPGKGTGLGLSVSYQIIVENHGGDLTVKSKPGVGTEFIIEIPINGEDDTII